jgi:hypothetical protein
LRSTPWTIFSSGKLIAKCHSINDFTDLIRNG